MLKNYLKLAIKVLLRRKFYSFISIMGIAFTLMVLIVTTAIIKTALYSNGAERNSGRYLVVDNFMQRRVVDGRTTNFRSRWLGYAFIEKYIEAMKTPEKVSYFTRPYTVVGYLDGVRIESTMKRTDHNYWNVFSFDFLEGRPFNQSESEQGRPLAVINHRTSDKYFGGDSALGETVLLDNIKYEIVGVVENVGYPEKLASSDIWTPIFATGGIDSITEDVGNFYAVLMAKDSEGLSQIMEEYTTIMENYRPPNSQYDEGISIARTNLQIFAREFPGLEPDLFKDFDFNIGAYMVADRVSVMFVMVFTGGFLFMLLPAINLINLNISRIMERSAEIGVRKSFGASSIVLVGQFAIENLVLTAIGGLVGFLMASLALYLLSHSGLLLITISHFNIDWPISFIGLVLILFFSLVSGLYPAWKMSRLDPVNALRGAVR